MGDAGSPVHISSMSTNILPSPVAIGHRAPSQPEFARPEVIDWLAVDHTDTAIRARLAAVPAGPWDIFCDADGHLVVEAVNEASGPIAQLPKGSGDGGLAVAAMIANIPTDLEYLLRRYDALLKWAATNHSDNAFRQLQDRNAALQAANDEMAMWKTRPHRCI